MNRELRQSAILSQAVQAAALAGTMQRLIDDLPEQVCLLDENAGILAVNRAWTETVEKHGYIGALPGGNYREFCDEAAAGGYQPAIEASAALEEMRAGKRVFWQLIYNGKERWDGRDFQIVFRTIRVNGQRLILVTRFDLTEIVELRRFKHESINALLERQSDERQRLGRDLHDSTSQLLTAIGLLLGSLKEGHSLGSDAVDLVDEMQELVTEAHQEIRSVSYLAHPPSLEKLGLAAALKSIVEGFARRTGLEASLEIEGELDPLDPTAENVIYRIAQEALSNVHRHSRATRIRLLLCLRRSTIHFIVADNGIGLAEAIHARTAESGTGLASMRARLSEIGGRLTIRELSPGTALIASIRDGSGGPLPAMRTQ